MRKVLFVLILCFSLVGCKSEEEKLNDKADKVVEILEAKKDEAIDTLSVNIMLYCSDLGKLSENPEAKKCGQTFLFDSAKIPTEFKNDYKQFIDKNTIDDSVSSLKSEYEKYTIQKMGISINKVTEAIVKDIGVKDNYSLNEFKYYNLTSALGKNLGDKKYMLLAMEIMKNDSIEWQQRKFLEYYQQ